VDRRVAAFAPSRLSEGIVKYSTSRAQHWLASRRTERLELIPVVQEWLKTLPRTQLELNRRVRAAANIVFATTGVATKQNLGLTSADEPFHWVLVEEAARAWPTELALPLVRGVRWTLIGDHAQIGAFSREEIERFLLECKDHQSPEIRAMYEARESYTRAFSTFAELFDSARSDVPRMTLTEQRRMTEQISTLVGNVFYAESGGLTARREPAPHPLTGPDYLLGSRLVWIDTGQAERAEGFWSNDNEADLCARVVRAMDPGPGTPGGPPLAVLTPYRKQQRLLTQRLSEHAARVFTVDGFQGQEADVVLVSLVRDRVGRDGTPISSVGHVASPSRTNVLLSRARELLVLVGRWETYANHAGPKWREVAGYFREHGLIVPAGVVRGS
jgi:superfamily I DNA and/or RNA helicase